ncbi:5-formyltetrahydrofolate cyclo-ligase [Neobacillus mesonae]|nr:5-formyltetrahydrofolate cyclo-ligase [Neobacillus mesonae]
MDQQHNLQLKKQLRLRMHQIRDSIPQDRRIETSRELCKQAIHEFEHLRALKGKKQLVIFSYLAYRSEADTSVMLKHFSEQKDTVLVPKVNYDSSLMELRVIHGMDDTETGRWGIPEPGSHTEVWGRERWTDIDMVIVPGLAYDPEGGRIGYGGGYYDRFAGELRSRSSELRLSGQNASLPVYAGLVLPGQLLPPKEIPMEPQDFRLNLLFTERGVLHI